jgi:trimethylamine--corrinoid protein Co-methyltransferase
MSQKHTLDHVRELYTPSLFDRESEVTWIKAGKKDVRDAARSKAMQILREHAPEPLPKDVQLQLREIVKNAERQLVKSR